MIATVNEVQNRTDIPAGIAELLHPFESQLEGKSVFVAGGMTTGQWKDRGASKYDVVILAGILEGAASPKLVMAGAAALLVSGGAILIATANGIGAGHIADGSTTRLGRRQLSDLARQAGFGHCHFYYPFPNLHRPAVLLSENAFDDGQLEVGNLIEPLLAGRDTGSSYPRTLVRALLDNGLMTELSDHFFIVISDNAEWFPAPGLLAWTFNPGRVPAFRKLNIFYRQGNELRVRPEPYDWARANTGTGTVRQELREERYQAGRLYSLELADILCNTGWSVGDVAGWARPYLQLLRRHLMPADGGEWIEGRYLDLVPFNLLVDGQQLIAIDMEWVAGERLPLQYLLFRGLYHSLVRMGNVARPEGGTPLNVFGLCLAVAEQLVADSDGMLEAFLEMEQRFFGGIFTRSSGPPADMDLQVEPARGEAKESTGLGSPGDDRLFPLFNLNLQVFVEGPDHPFSEESSATLQVGLTDRRKVYSLHLPYFTEEVTRLRIDPSDHCGLVLIHAIHLTCEGEELFYWTPWSRCGVELSGMMILNAGPSLPGPAAILLNHDPMMIFSLARGARKMPMAPVILEIEASAPARDLSDEFLNNFQHLRKLLPQ